MFLLRDENGASMSSEQENKAMIQQHFALMFDQAGGIMNNKKTCIRAMEEARPIIVEQQQVNLLDKGLTREEINDAFDALKCNKSLGVDGLIAKFF